jgi:hypothetical protein
MNQLSERYLEDFAVGQTFGSGRRLRIDGERALAFAAEFDPQPFHLDEAARRSIFRGLTASGWYTVAVTMRLLVETELKPAGGIVGAGLDDLNRRERRHRPDPYRLRHRSRAEDQCAGLTTRASRSPSAESQHRLPVLQCNTRQHRREVSGGVSAHQQRRVSDGIIGSARG